MADIYIEIGDMDYNQDTNKVALKYAVKAAEAMRAAAANAVTAATGFTLQKPKEGNGYRVNLTLNEIAFGTRQGQPSVTCLLLGAIDALPKKELITKSLTGSATSIGSTSDRDVVLTIGDAVTATMNKSVLPTLKSRTP
jgi:hypothetical protein